jgi:hypothetical protein
MSDDTSTQQATQNATQQAMDDPIAAAVAGIELNKISRDDVFVDLIHNSKLFAFRLMVAANLLERVMKRDGVQPEQPSEPPSEQPSES